MTKPVQTRAYACVDDARVQLFQANEASKGDLRIITQRNIYFNTKGVDWSPSNNNIILCIHPRTANNYYAKDET